MHVTHSTVYSGNSPRFVAREPCPQCRGRRPMTSEAKSPHIGEIALSPAFRHGYDVVRIPKRFPASLPQSPLFQKLSSGCEIQASHVTAQRHGIYPALRTHSGIAL
jgi:hypothetical protein